MKVFRDFLKNREAAAAVEFALVLPFLITIYVAGSDAAMAVSVNRKIHNAASTINDLVGQSTAFTATSLDALFDVTASLLQPYDPSNVYLRVTQVKVDSSGNAVVDWTRSKNPMIGTTVLRAGAPYALPASLSGEDSIHILVTEAYYSYETLGGYGFGSSILMGETNYLSPRLGDKVTCSNC